MLYLLDLGAMILAAITGVEGGILRNLVPDDTHRRSFVRSRDYIVAWIDPKEINPNRSSIPGEQGYTQAQFPPE